VAAAGDSRDGMRVAQELTGVTFAYTHAISLAVAAAYMSESEALAAHRQRGRRDLLDALLAGEGDAAAHARRAESLGLRTDVPSAVVVAQAGDDPQAVRLAAQALAAGEPAGAFVVPRHGEVTAVLPVYVRRGPRDLSAALGLAAERLQRSHGVELRAGVSAVCSGLGEVARAYAEARGALRHAPPVGAVALEEVRLFDYLAERADAGAERLVTAAVQRLAEADMRQAGALASTLRAYADCDLNVARTAERLVVHPNTVHYRLRRVADLSGRDPRRFDDLVELLTSLKLLARDAPSPA
jgi:sugar diacid utilization regulator